MTKTEKRIETLEKRVSELECRKADDPLADFKRSLKKENSQKEYVPYPYPVYPPWQSYPPYPHYVPRYISTTGGAWTGTYNMSVVDGRPS